MKKVIGISFVLLAAGLLFTAVTTNFENQAPDGLSVGDTAPDFKLQDAITGNTVSLSDYKDVNGYIVIFTCNTCPYAVMYEDRIIELDEMYTDKGWPVIAIMPNDPDVKPGDAPDAMKQRAKEKGFDFPYLFDDGQKVYPQYGATRTPHVFLLDKDRKVRYIGAIDDNPQSSDNVKEKFVANAIAAMEEGKSPEPSLTKAIGCTIKTK